MGDQPHKTSAKPVSEATKKIKHPAPAVQAVLEAEPLSLFADPMMLQRAMANPGGLPPTAIPGLQRAVGNQHVQLMLARTEPAAGIAAQIQKQTIEDYTRQQAAPDEAAQIEVAQRQPDADGGVELSDAMTGEINQGLRQSGSPLPRGIQTKMKRNLGIANPEEIEVHTDQQADTLSKALGARAFTTGSHIFFRQGEYDPGSTKGQALLYHEGVHTVQQGGVRGNAPQAKMVVNPPDDQYEQEAEAVAEQAILAPEPTQPQFVEPSAAPKTTPHVSQKDDEENDERAVPTTSYVQMAEEKEEEKEESKEEKKEEEKEAKEKEKEEKEREKEAQEKGKEKEQESKESGEEKKDSSKGKAKDEGKRAGKPKEKKTSPKIPKGAEFTPPPPKVDPSVVDNIDGDTATEVKFDPDAFEFEEPEQEPLLPTWDELAEGTVQLSMEEVQEEYRIRLTLAASDPADFEGIDDPKQGFNVEPGEPAEPTKSGADLVGEAFAQGALAGFKEGAESWATDTALEMATSKIKYADGLINLVKLANDPKAWVQDNVFAIGDSAKAMAGAFKDIGSEKTGWGVIAATLEAAIAVIDFINSIIGLINQILTMLLWILRALLTVSNFMVGLSPMAIVIFPVVIFPFAWTPAVFSPIASFCSFAISWLDPLNTVVGQIGTVLGLVKFQLQPFAIMFRTIDMLTYKGDPEEMEKKQAKLQSNISGFVNSATTKMLENTKNKAVDGINKRRDQRKVKKLEDQVETGDSPDLQARIAAKKEEFKEKYGESVEDFRGKSKKQTAWEATKAAAAVPGKVLGQMVGVEKKEGEWKAVGIAGGVAAIKKKGFGGAIKAGAKGLAKTFKERRSEVQKELKKEQAAVREKAQKRAEKSKKEIEEAGRKEPALAVIALKGIAEEKKTKVEKATKKTEKWIGEPKKTKAEREAEAERAKHLTAQQQAEADAQHKRQQAKNSRDAARAAELQAGEHQKKAKEAAEAKRNHEEDSAKFDKQADEAKSSAETQRKKAAEEEKTQKRLEKEAGESEAAAKKERDKASQLNKGSGDAEKQASAAKKEAEGKQQELGNAQEKAKAANQSLEEAKRKKQEMEEKCDKVLQGPGGMDTGKSQALRELELAERRVAEAQTKADTENERVAKLQSEMKEINARRQKAETEAQQKKEASDKAQREADRLQAEADKKKTEAQEAEKRKADSLKEAGKFDDVAKQKRAAAKKAQDDVDEAERQRKHHEDETDRFVGVAKNKRDEADLYDEAAEGSELIAKKESYRAKPPEEDEDLDDWIDKVIKWQGEPVFGGQRHGPGTIGTNLIYWLMQTPWVDEEYEEARAKTDQALDLKNARQYQQALDIVKGLDAESWQKKADSLKELLGPRWGRQETIDKFETLASDIRSFYVYDPSNLPPSVGQRLKLQINTLTPGLPDSAARVNGGETAFVVTVIEKVGGDVKTPVKDEITDFPQGTNKVEKDYYSLLPASQRPISLAVRPKSVEFKVNGAERTYTPKYRKVDKYNEKNLTRYEVWIGYESSLQFTSAAVTTATIGENYYYDITATSGDEGGDLTITAPTKPTWLALTDNGDGTATLTGTPAAGNGGDHDVELQVSDSAGFTATQSFTVTVRERLAFTSVPATTVAKGEDYRYDITAQDLDAQPGDQLVITAQTKPTWLTFTDNGEGAATLEGDAANLQIGEHQVELKAERQRGGTAVSQTTQSFILTVRPVMGFTSTPITYATRGEAYSYSITTEGFNGRTISAPTKPTWLDLTDNGDGTATLTGTPSDTTPVGQSDVTLQVSETVNSVAFTATQSFKVTVRTVPQFTSTAVTTVYKDVNYSYAITVTDPDTAGSQLAITAPTKPDWLSLTDNGDGTATLTGTPTNEHKGDHSVELKVEDEYGYTATQSFTVTVSEPVQTKRSGDGSAGTAVQGERAVLQRQPDFAAIADEDGGAIQGGETQMAGRRAGAAVAEELGVAQRQPDLDHAALVSEDAEAIQAKQTPAADEEQGAIVQEDLTVQGQPDLSPAIAGQDTGTVRDRASNADEDTRAVVWDELAVIQRQLDSASGAAIADRGTEATEREETPMTREEPGAVAEDGLGILQRQPDSDTAITRSDTAAVEEEAPIATEEPGAAVEDEPGILQRQPDLIAGPDMEAAEGPDALIAGEDVEATKAVHQEEGPLEVTPVQQPLVVQLQTEGEEEEDEEAFISESDIAYQKSLAARASLLEMAPEPPENMIERVQGAALAYEEADAEEYDLALQQQQIGGLIEHGQGQMVELEGTRQMTAVNKQGVAAQIQDAETQMQAQDQMQSQLASQEGQAKQTAKQGSEGQNVMSQIFGKIMSAFGLGSSQGAGDNGAQGQSGAMKSGVQDTSKTTGATADATKSGQQSVTRDKGRTMKVKEGAESAQDDLNQLDDKLASDLEENQEGLDELGEAAATNEESLATVQGEKERLRDEHMNAVSIAEMWAEEHRFVREQVFSQLESELA